MKVLQPVLFLAFSIIAAGCANRCTVRGNEKLEFYPTYAVKSVDQKTWTANVHGRLSEPHAPSTAEEVTLNVARGFAMLSKRDEEMRILEERLEPFRAQAKDGRAVAVAFTDQTFKLAKSDKSGDIVGQAVIKADAVPAATDHPGWVPFSLKGCKAGDDAWGGRVVLIEPQGVSVISDIDDTIKVSSVTSRRALIESTFLRPYRAVPGMANVYAHWQKKGAQFHYLSMSPWQLYGPLSTFLDREGFPAGVLHLRTVRTPGQGATARVLMESLSELMAPAREVKLKELETLFKAFPQRKFILVGDSGEQDPEIYAEIARRFPSQVKLIAIRDSQRDGDPARFATAFEGLPTDLWRVFRSPGDLEDAL